MTAVRGLIVFAHGSRVEEANERVRALSRDVAERTQFDFVSASFLELGSPSLPEAVREAVGFGARDIIIVPYFLVPGRHTSADLPGIVDELRNIYPGVSIKIAKSLDGHPALLDIVVERATESLRPEGIR